MMAGMLSLTLTACGGRNTSSSGEESQGKVEDNTLNLVGSIYPLQYVLQEVAGPGYLTSSLADKNVEPHDMEMTPQRVESVEKADLVLTLKGFQPAVDDATKDKDNVMDASGVVKLQQRNGATDYHFWLDPARMALLADAVAKKLGELDPDRAGEYTSNAAELEKELATLDSSIRTSLATCQIKDLFTAHAAFGYLTAKTNLKEQSLLGANPEAEPNPTQVAAAVRKIKAAKVTTIYGEPLVPDKTIQTIAEEGGVNVGTLDPIEGLSDRGAGFTYPELMTSNLQTLEVGQKCGAGGIATEDGTGSN